MYYIWRYISFYLRPIFKWFLRKTTGLCELQRICYGEVSSAPTIKAVERSLSLSRSPQIQQLVARLNFISDNRRFTGANEREVLKSAVETVLFVKKINADMHVHFVNSFRRCIEQIWGYRQLLCEVEELRRTPFDCDNFEHEQKLYQLWDKLMPDEILEGRITEQWQEIGFQGDDPSTDFRGMGMLGLENLLFFASEYTGPACHVLAHSHHPLYCYSFAIVGINLTHMAWILLKEGQAKTYFYNGSESLPTISLFHRFYSYLFCEFDMFWIESKPNNIMDFSTIKSKFENNILLSLQDP